MGEGTFLLLSESLLSLSSLSLTLLFEPGSQL